MWCLEHYTMFFEHCLSTRCSCHNMASEMAPVLHKLRLDHFIDKLSSEKITPDLVGKLPLSDLRELRFQM